MRDRKDCVLLSQKKCEKFEKRVFLEFWESNLSGTIKVKPSSEEKAKRFEIRISLFVESNFFVKVDMCCSMQASNRKKKK